MNAKWGIASGVILVLATAPVLAVTPAERCEAGKLKVAAKFDLCRLKLAAKAAQTGIVPDYFKCNARFGSKWNITESGAGGACPSNGDQAAIQAFIIQHTDDLAVALAGGPLPNCSGNLASCVSDLATCDASLATCNANLAATNVSLEDCSQDLTTCGDSLDTCSADLVNATAALASCSSDLASTTASLATCDSNLALCSAALGTCPADLAACLAAPPGGLTKTGQTMCYNDIGSVIACAGTGQDGEAQVGLNPSFTDNGDGTITDNRTGLTWEKLSDDGSVHDWNSEFTFAAAFTKVSTLNSDTFGGHSDWRVPNIVELESLRNMGTHGPAVRLPFHMGCTGGCTVFTCNCTGSTNYWSATTSADLPGLAWIVNFHSGAVANRGKGLTALVRAVRGGP